MYSAVRIVLNVQNYLVTRLQ